MSSEPRMFGPVQMLVLEFDRTEFEGEILPELERLKEAGIVRLIDLLFVRKPVGGEIEVVQTSDLSQDEAETFGAIVGALVGFGTGSEEETLRAAEAGAEELEDGHFFGDSEVWYLGDAIPEGKSAAVALLEHTWATQLVDAIGAAGGRSLGEGWLAAEDRARIPDA
jgi:uncharacterized membrane protein